MTNRVRNLDKITKEVCGQQLHIQLHRSLFMHGLYFLFSFIVDDSNSSMGGREWSICFHGAVTLVNECFHIDLDYLYIGRKICRSRITAGGGLCRGADTLR